MSALRATLALGGVRAAPPTGRKDCDAHTALTRGLAEYLSGVVAIGEGGRKLQFAAAFDTWPEAEQAAKYPALIVHGADAQGQYEPSRFTPGESLRERTVLPDGRFLRVFSNYSVLLSAEIWANDPKARFLLAAAVEEALNPEDDRNGFFLELPHYCGLRASYTVEGNTYPDGDDPALKRYRRATFRVRASVDVVRLVGTPIAQRPVVTVEVLEPGSELGPIKPGDIVRGVV